MKTKTERYTNTSKPAFHLNIGSASILLIFVILCLVSFATLSIVSANADNKLNSKILDRTTAYYEACNLAENELSDIETSLINVYGKTADAEEYFAMVGHSKSYTIPINDLQSLQVEIEILYPAEAEDFFYRITSWQVITLGDLEM